MASRFSFPHRYTHFALAKDHRAGDELTVQRVDDRRTRYRVTGLQTVCGDALALPSQPARPLLVLATCYPFDAARQGPLRRVVWAAKAVPPRDQPA